MEILGMQLKEKICYVLLSQVQKDSLFGGPKLSDKTNDSKLSPNDALPLILFLRNKHEFFS